MMSVKLKLFEIMDTKDKWTLFFLSGHGESSNTYKVLPTFIASDIDWRYFDSFVEDRPCNFDTDCNNGSSAITLHHHHNLHLHYLQLTPNEYYVHAEDYAKQFLSKNPQYQKTLFHHLKLDKHCLIDIVFVFQYRRTGRLLVDQFMLVSRTCVALIGSFKENKWTLCRTPWAHGYKELKDPYNNNDHSTVFNIY
ncbi:hypothetical protein BCR42DRAFT_152618 [Absidia repens]|uniref:Uncharacterized protein n=1 Tax=Absidia repens TaxID=90262 RepID=A0A1X2I2Z1_9FUNG|nr:hypothetical protein BCR42DRAFT_152618 [Absidia repens]